MASNRIRRQSRGSLHKMEIAGEVCYFWHGGKESRHEHEEYRHTFGRKLTVNDYIRARMQRAGAFDIDIDLARLMGSPVNRKRLSARNQCRLSDKTLSSRASKFLTLASEYAQRRTFARIMAKPPSNVFPAWAKGYNSNHRHVASSWPSYREQQIANILAAEGPAGLIGLDGVGEVIEITDVQPLRLAA